MEEVRMKYFRNPVATLQAVHMGMGIIVGFLDRQQAIE
jgi:hypothetical protein